MLKNGSSKPMKIFYAYSHRDEKLRDKLEMHLSTLKHQNIITNWHDRKIKAGGEWENEIEAHLNAAQIILLLISPEFLASDCWCKIEISALELYELGKACVIPIILRPVNWSNTLIGKLQALPTDAKPITSSAWHNQDEAFLDVVEGICKAIEKVNENTYFSTSHFQEITANSIFLKNSEPAKITTKKHILIADDELSSIKFCKAILSQVGDYYISYVMDGREALVLINRIHIDLLILDISMGRIGGLTVIELLRKKRIKTPIIVISQYFKFNREAIELGADYYLCKPFRFFDFKDAVLRLL